MTILAAVTWLSTVYLICFFLGVAYALLSGLFSAIGGLHFGGPPADVDIGADLGSGGDVNLGGGHDVVAGIDAHAGDIGGHEPGAAVGGDVGITPFSPIIVAVTLVCFGATGIIFTYGIDLGILSLLPSAFSGLAMGAVVFFVLYTFMKSVQASSSPSLAELIDLEAEAATPIPSDGIGQISYVARGSRFTAQARSVVGSTLPIHSAVVIVKWVGNTAYVKPAL